MMEKRCSNCGGTMQYLGDDKIQLGQAGVQVMLCSTIGADRLGHMPLLLPRTFSPIEIQLARGGRPRRRGV